MPEARNERRSPERGRKKTRTPQRPYRSPSDETSEKKSDKFINTLLFQSGICVILILAAIGIKNSPGELAAQTRGAVSSIISRTSGEEEVGAFFSEAASVYNEWKERAIAVFSNKDGGGEEQKAEEEEKNDSPFLFDEQTSGEDGPEPDLAPVSFAPLELTRTGLFMEKTDEPYVITTFFDLGKNDEEYQDYETGEVREEFTREVDFRIINLGMELSKPVEGEMTSGFGERIHPITGQLSFHYGVDLKEKKGTVIKAAQKGNVKEVGTSSAYGNYVIIQHDNDTETFYGHCDKITAKEGQDVKTGDKIATVGSTGLSTGSHLHFEIRRDGKVLNPEGYFNFVPAE